MNELNTILYRMSDERDISDSYLDTSGQSDAIKIMSDVGSTPLVTEKQRREDMIIKEMDGIFESVQEYLLERMMDEAFVIDEVKIALQKAALQLAYTRKFEDTMEDKTVYVPTCKKLILTDKLLVEARDNYYQNDDGFPDEFITALKAVVSRKESRKVKEKKGRDRSSRSFSSVGSSRVSVRNQSSRHDQLEGYEVVNEDDEDDDAEDSIGSNNSSDDDSLLGSDKTHNKMNSDMMEKLAMSWREAIDETLAERLALC